MILALAQTRPLPGDIPGNVEDHLEFIKQAAQENADILFFPELSLTGYEPALAEDLATTLNDSTLKVFREQSAVNNMTIAIGLPLKTGKGILIGMGIFEPGKGPLLYGKKYLHPDEERYFVPGPNLPPLRIKGMSLSTAICYELSIEQHRIDAVQAGAELYVASVAKVKKGTRAAHETLSETAKNTSMITAMVNCVGPAATGITVGQSAVWDKDGEVVMMLDDSSPGLLLYNTESGKAEEIEM